MLKKLKAAWDWYRKLDRTYKGYVNLQELVTVLGVIIISGGSVNVILLTLLQHIKDIVVDPAMAEQITTILTNGVGIIAGFIALWKRLKLGQDSPPPPPMV